MVERMGRQSFSTLQCEQNVFSTSCLLTKCHALVSLVLFENMSISYSLSSKEKIHVNANKNVTSRFFLHLNFTHLLGILYTINKNWNKKRRDATKTRFSTIQSSIDLAGIRNERWQWRKNNAIILIALVACTK